MTATSARLHRARALLHRFFASIEGATDDISQVLHAVENDVRLRTMVGDANGRAELLARFAVAPGTKVSHEIRRFSADASRDDRTVARFELVRHIVRDDGAHDIASLDCEVVLLESGAEPRITSLYARTAEEPSSVDMSFRESFTTHRALATFFTWLALLDTRSGELGDVEELLADDELRLAPRPHTGELVNARSVKGYIAARRDFLVESKHVVNLVKVDDNGDGTCSLRALVSWSGTTRDGEPASDRTEHRWTLVDDGKRYARVQSIRTDVVVPFALKRASERPQKA